MWEVSENLHRVDLTQKQKHEHIRRYIALRERAEKEKAENQVGTGVPPEIGFKKPPPQKKGVAAKYASELGVSKRTINKALASTRKPDKDVTEPATERASNPGAPRLNVPEGMTAEELCRQGIAAEADGKSAEASRRGKFIYWET